MEKTLIMFLQYVLITIVSCILHVTAPETSDDQQLREYELTRVRNEPCTDDETSGHCYKFFDSLNTWKEASDLCKHDGGNLVTIESVEEQKLIADQLQKKAYYREGFWIGSDKLYPEEQRAWVNGEKFSYVNWAPGKPDNPQIDENCVEIYTNDSTWNDVKCTQKNGYICENSRAVTNYIQDNYTGRWYKLVEELITWDDAFDICDKNGSMLMIIESPKEQAFIADQIRQIEFNATGLWIGSNMVHPERKRTWTNGKKFTYVNWAEGEPNNSPYLENCAELYCDSGMWNDRNCAFLGGFICEKSPEVTPPYKLQEVYIIIISVGSALLIVVGVTILCCLLHKRSKCKKKKNEDYQDVQNMEMNQAEHEYNRGNVMSDTYCTIDDNQLTPDDLTSRKEIY